MDRDLSLSTSRSPGSLSVYSPGVPSQLMSERTRREPRPKRSRYSPTPLWTPSQSATPTPAADLVNQNRDSSSPRLSGDISRDANVVTPESDPGVHDHDPSNHNELSAYQDVKSDVDSDSPMKENMVQKHVKEEVGQKDVKEEVEDDRQPAPPRHSLRQRFPQVSNVVEKPITSPRVTRRSGKRSMLTSDNESPQVMSVLTRSTQYTPSPKLQAIKIDKPTIRPSQFSFVSMDATDQERELHVSIASNVLMKKWHSNVTSVKRIRKNSKWARGIENSSIAKTLGTLYMQGLLTKQPPTVRETNENHIDYSKKPWEGLSKVDKTMLERAYGISKYD